MLKEVIALKQYRNIKTGNIYIVNLIGKNSENPEELLVVYQRDEDVWIRPLELFKVKFEEI